MSPLDTQGDSGEENTIEGDKDTIRTPEQLEVLERLKKAKSSAERVDVVATALDTFGLDVIVGLIPVEGDGASSIIAGLYLLAEAKHADLGAMSYLKIIALQVADFAIGVVPVVGDAADYVFQANKMSAGMFAKNMEQIKQEAVKMGIPPEEIAKISDDGKNLPQLAKQAISVVGKAKAGKASTTKTA